MIPIRRALGERELGKRLGILTVSTQPYQTWSSFIRRFRWSSFDLKFLAERTGRDLDSLEKRTWMMSSDHIPC